MPFDEHIPWLVFITAQHKEKRDHANEEEFQNQDCTGSVISERFVLTSETCVPDGDWLSYHVKVVYGDDDNTVSL